MGASYRYHCPKCGEDHIIRCGMFFRSPATAEEVLSGGYGERAKRNFERHPGTSALFSHQVFRCGCGYARSKEVMVIFADDQAPWSMYPGRGIVWHNVRCRCARCGKSMSPVSEPPRSIRCTCGKWTEPMDLDTLFD